MQPTSSNTESRPRASMVGRINELKAELRKRKRKCRAIMKSQAKQGAKMAMVFGKDQLEAMSRGGMSGVTWSSNTAKKALQIRFSCGSSGYKFLQEQQFPSERTFQRCMEKLAFQPEILWEAFDCLMLKVCGMKEEERLPVCCLTLD